MVSVTLPIRSVVALGSLFGGAAILFGIYRAVRARIRIAKQRGRAAFPEARVLTSGVSREPRVPQIQTLHDNIKLQKKRRLASCSLCVRPPL